MSFVGESQCLDTLRKSSCVVRSASPLGRVVTGGVNEFQRERRWGRGKDYLYNSPVLSSEYMNTL